MHLTVKTDSTVTWSGLKEETHDVVCDSGLFRSGALEMSERLASEFGQPETCPFARSLHHRLVHTLIVD
jgi:hypothetical protein